MDTPTWNKWIYIYAGGETDDEDSTVCCFFALDFPEVLIDVALMQTSTWDSSAWTPSSSSDVFHFTNNVSAEM